MRSFLLALEVLRPMGLGDYRVQDEVHDRTGRDRWITLRVVWYRIRKRARPKWKVDTTRIDPVSNCKRTKVRRKRSNAPGRDFGFSEYPPALAGDGVERKPRGKKFVIVPPSTPIYADPTTTWACEISSPYHGRTVEREAEMGTSPTPSKEDGPTWRFCLARSQISESDPRLCKHLLLRPRTPENLTVRNGFASGGSSNNSPTQSRRPSDFQAISIYFQRKKQTLESLKLHR